jgi:hypothetical protein
MEGVKLREIESWEVKLRESEVQGVFQNGW